MQFDDNLAAIHAYLCADGYVIKNPPSQTSKYYHIGFRNTNLLLLKDFQERFNSYFGIKPYLIEGQRCRIGSKKLYELLTKEFGSFYSWHWSMPQMNEGLVRTWLRAFFDCDGWAFCKTHQNRVIGLDCVNIKGLRQIERELFNLGIASRIKKRNGRNIYSLSIYGKDNIRRFREKIGFLHPEKKNRLDNTISDYVDYSWSFPSDEKEQRIFIVELMKRKAKLKKNNGIIRLISKEESNLAMLKSILKETYSVESKINKNVNGLGTIYYQLSINKKSEINKLISFNLLNEECKTQWLKLRK